MVAINNKRGNLKKLDIVKKIHLNIGLPSAYASKVLNNLIDILRENLKLYNKLKIKNFGVFTLQHKDKRIGRNPKNKAKYDISERIVATFKASCNLKKKINKDVKN
jgi:nucleoid DNA-binding protein